MGLEISNNKLDPQLIWGVKLNRKENMTKEFIITCPNCDETFAADDAFKNHLKKLI